MFILMYILWNLQNYIRQLEALGSLGQFQSIII